jgi:hypothetical protein
MTEKRLQLLRSGGGGSLTRAGLVFGHLLGGLQAGSGWKEATSGFLAVDRTARIISIRAAGSILRWF